MESVCLDSGSETEKQYYVTDPHGSVLQLTDENGKVTKTYEYDSFGNEVKPDKKDENPFRYCGEYYDKETEEIYLRARYYQPKMGRFLTRDTYTGEEDEPESLHLYTYCYNNPVVYSDNGGNSPVSDVLAAGMRVMKNVSASTKSKKPSEVFMVNDLRIDTDGVVNGLHGDSSHLPDTAYFQGRIAADEIPYFVVPYYTKEQQNSTNDYIYGVVADNNDKIKKNTMGEVSIYAVWNIKKLLKKKPNMKKIYTEGNYGIILYAKSAPKGGWKANIKKPAALRKKILKQGKKCFKGVGKCLNKK